MMCPRPSRQPWRYVALFLVVCIHLELLRVLHSQAALAATQQGVSQNDGQNHTGVAAATLAATSQHDEESQKGVARKKTMQKQKVKAVVKKGVQQKKKTAQQQKPLFAFDAVFGDNMVLQRAPSKAAVYGFLGHCDVVKLVMFDGDLNIVNEYSGEDVMMNVTKQPFGAEWGDRPCSKKNCPPYNMDPFNPWNEPLATWKVILDPMEPGGNYTINAECISGSDAGTVMITNVTFGDVWYCSGQSNMWLPLLYTFSRKETHQAILDGKYHNIRIMSGHSNNHPYYGSPDTTLNGFNRGYGNEGGSNPWQTALQAVEEKHLKRPRLFLFGATCFYFAQRLVDLGVDDIPIGLANTAIGGQRIELFMENSTINRCSARSGEKMPYWDSVRFAEQVLPFVDMTVKGWVWYQGENNMDGVKGNAMAHVGYSCEMRELINGWRRIWSEADGTTDPLAPFGVVTLAPSGNENGDDMGAMRHAQTANHGVLPNPELPNTFLAQAYDLDDEWGPAKGPCFKKWRCCSAPYAGIKYNAKKCMEHAETCKTACAVEANAESMGGIHPRSKKHVGDRLGVAAFNTVYGGTGAFTGPTLEGCTVVEDEGWLEIRFNSTLLRGGSLVLRDFPPRLELPKLSKDQPTMFAGGSQLYVQTEASHFCMEPLPCPGSPKKQCCAEWAGGSGDAVNITSFDDKWIMLNFSIASKSSIRVDLSPLNGAAPTAVRYAWGVIDCCDISDKTLYVDHGCIANCPLMGSSDLPANPFQAKIVAGECYCVAPQVCSVAESSLEDNG